MRLHYIIILAGIFVFTSCADINLNVFEKTMPFATHAWSSKEKPQFNFTVTDTAARYNIFVVLRHTDAYHFNNIWLNIYTTAPGDTAKTQQLNLQLGDNSKGWLGAAMDDIIEHRILITKNPVPLRKGAYTFSLEQIMREDPLQNIMNAGIRVEKVVE